MTPAPSASVPSKPAASRSTTTNERARLLVVDNYDSFTFNLVQMFRQFPLSVQVARSDAITVSEIARDCPDYIVLSPGPKDPEHAGICVELIKELHPHVPMLGVCLGMQCINEAFGGETVRSARPCHGKTSAVFHEGSGLFAGLGSPFRAARYHSLAVSLASDPLQVTAHTEEGLIMGLAHPTSPLFGLQFHPESFLTEHGFQLLENFLHLQRSTDSAR